MLWLAVQVAMWPAALSFGDEIGYLGQAKILLSGRIVPEPADPGIWLLGPKGLTGRYPLSFPLLIAPLIAMTPRAVFLAGVVPALALAWWASRVLKSWGRAPVWGAILLAHPTIVLIARTAMTDVLFSACAVGSWLALRRGRPAITLLAFFALTCIKPHGFLLGGALIAGEALRALPSIRRGARSEWLRLAIPSIGVVAGSLLLLGFNLLNTGSLRGGYELELPPGISQFSLRNLPHNAWSFAQGLLLAPPLLVLGIVPLWKRREYGVVACVLGLGGLMSMYWFVDWGRNALETMVLAPRLILPVVSMLLVGYADLLAGVSLRRPISARLAGVAVASVVLLAASAISAVHARWQRPAAAGLAAAAAVAARTPRRELALTPAARKAGLLYDGSTVNFDPKDRRASVVLCSTVSDSHRLDKTHFDCEYPGYRVATQAGGFKVLVAN